MSFGNTLWKREFAETLTEIEDELRPREAVNSLRFLVGTGMLALDDLQHDPQKFFLAHRMLAGQVHRVGSGLWMRFQLHYNLFAGTVLALGSQRQIDHFVNRNLDRPIVGCFALTEQKQGDNSHGFCIETTAELSPGERYFSINTPNPSAAKTWVSQGLMAEECVLIATLVVQGNSYGPQAFLIKLRDEHGNLLDGITLIDMGRKASGSDLDHARITFTNLSVPISTHLCKYLKVESGTVRQSLGNRIRIMDVIGHRLFTGRVSVAGAALTHARTVLGQTHDLRGNRSCMTPFSRTRTSKVGARSKPYMSKTFLPDAFMVLDTLDTFVRKIEAQLCQCLLRNIVPPASLQQAIAVAKVESVETCIDFCSAMEYREESEYKNGLGESDFLLCCKYAEGESHMLMQKMARDILTHHATGIEVAEEGTVDAALQKLQRELVHIQIGSGSTLLNAWRNSSEHVYNLADAHMDGVLKSYGCMPRDRNTT